MADGQLELTFNVLNGGDVEFRVAERRVIVTPDESATDGTKYLKNDPTKCHDLLPLREESRGRCRRCKKGELYLFTYSKGKNDMPGETALRCTYCE